MHKHALSNKCPNTPCKLDRWFTTSPVQLCDLVASLALILRTCMRRANLIEIENIFVIIGLYLDNDKI